MGREYVVDGATMKCTMGSKSCKLKVSNNRKYTMRGKKVATIMDFAPGINIFPPLGAFGTCKPYSTVPPPGNLCTPLLSGPWKMPYMPKTIGVLRPILDNSFNICPRGGGIIKFQKTGQKK